MTEKVSSKVAAILAQGRPPFVVVDFPRYDHNGKPIAQVHLRLLDVNEEQLALARAQENAARLLKNVEKGYKPESNDVEYNERWVEILAIACRDADDPSKPFFEYGVYELRKFNAEEISVLAVSYARLKDKHPRNDEMSVEQYDALVLELEGELHRYPFSSWPLALLTTFTESCVRRLAPFLRTSTATTSGDSAALSGASQGAG